MSTDLTPDPDLGAWLDELERLHAAWQVGGWDGFEAGLKLPHAVPRLVAAVRAVEALADELDWLVIDETVDQTARIAHAWTVRRLRSALTAALASERTTP